MKDCWLDEGKDDEGRREWERRWREAGNIMTEEDMMEICIMHASIPYYVGGQAAFVLPSECSFFAMSVVLNEYSKRDLPYHFQVFDINNHPQNVVIIRNLPLSPDLRWQVVDEIHALIQSLFGDGFVLERLPDYRRDEDNFSGYRPFYPVLRVSLKSSEDSKKLVERLSAITFNGKHLIAKEGMRRMKENGD